MNHGATCRLLKSLFCLSTRDVPHICYVETCCGLWLLLLWLLLLLLLLLSLSLSSFCVPDSEDNEKTDCTSFSFLP